MCLYFSPVTQAPIMKNFHIWNPVIVGECFHTSASFLFHTSQWSLTVGCVALTSVAPYPENKTSDGVRA